MTPLKLFWFRKRANFGDGISPLIVAHLAGREVVWAAPRHAELFAVGSILRKVGQVCRDGISHRPWIWGSGFMKPVDGGFLEQVRVAALRGPKSGEVLKVHPLVCGDPGILIADVPGAAAQRGDAIGIVPHFSQLGSANISEVVAAVPGCRLIDVGADDPMEVVRQIGGCRHVFSSSLHGLVVADALGIGNTWMDPTGIHASPEFKFQDYACSIGRELGTAILPRDIPAAVERLDHAAPLPYLPRLDALKAGLREAFPAELR